LEVKNVVTSFIQFEDSILILKRSDKVGLHQSRWAGVSGYLEKNEDPLKRALKEIEEEIGLLGETIELQRISEPIGIPEPEIDTFWIVYPHLFKTSSNEVKLNWENTEYRWIDPIKIWNYATVPALNEVLQMVFPTPIENIIQEQKIVDRITKIRDDNSSTASQLAKESVITFHEAVEAFETRILDEYMCLMKTLALSIMNLRPSIAPIRNQIGHLIFQMVNSAMNNLNLEELKLFFAKETSSLLEEADKLNEHIAENVFKIIPEKAVILTHSYSATVLESLKYASDKGKKIQIIASESRPLFEGRTTAKELTEYGISTTIVTDAAAPHFAGNVNLVLIGADSLLADGSVVNKVGTYPIALSASYQGIPVYVAADLNKINLKSYFSRVLLEEKDQSEIWPSSPSNIGIRNLYFDITPKALITLILTETQKLRADELLRVCEVLVKNRYII